MNTMPPMTPPAIGPAGEDDDDGADDGAAKEVQFVMGHWSHPPVICVHTSFSAQVGHGGGCGGQLAHRLNNVGLEKSASAFQDQ